MTDLSVTAANVVRGSDAITRDGYAGVAITAGQAVVLDPSTKKYVLADSNHATAALRKPTGIALNSAAIGQPVEVQTGGTLTTGATMTANIPYMQSDAPGGICPIADVGSGEYLCIVYVAISTTVALLNIVSTGVAN